MTHEPFRALGGIGKIESKPHPLRCPVCLHNGLFQRQSEHEAYFNSTGISNVAAGTRFCPNPQCNALVFIVSVEDRILASYPPVRVDFDATNLPDKVLNAFEEAIACHSIGAYNACGMMIRRTMEEVCNEKKANGKNLKTRIKDLRNHVTIPTALLDGIDEIRILGNEAAHVKAKDYDDVGQDECDVGLDLAKAILRAVYQYGELLTRLKNLKKTSP